MQSSSASPYYNPEIVQNSRRSHPNLSCGPANGANGFSQQVATHITDSTDEFLPAITLDQVVLSLEFFSPSSRLKGRSKTMNLSFDMCTGYSTELRGNFHYEWRRLPNTTYGELTMHLSRTKTLVFEIQAYTQQSGTIRSSLGYASYKLGKTKKKKRNRTAITSCDSKQITGDCNCNITSQTDPTFSQVGSCCQDWCKLGGQNTTTASDCCSNAMLYCPSMDGQTECSANASNSTPCTSGKCKCKTASSNLKYIGGSCCQRQCKIDMQPCGQNSDCCSNYCKYSTCQTVDGGYDAAIDAAYPCKTSANSCTGSTSASDYTASTDLAIPCSSDTEYLEYTNFGSSKIGNIILDGEIAYVESNPYNGTIRQCLGSATSNSGTRCIDGTSQYTDPTTGKLSNKICSTSGLCIESTPSPGCYITDSVTHAQKCDTSGYYSCSSSTACYGITAAKASKNGIFYPMSFS